MLIVAIFFTQINAIAFANFALLIDTFAHIISVVFQFQRVILNTKEFIIAQ